MFKITATEIEQLRPIDVKLGVWYETALLFEENKLIIDDYDHNISRIKGRTSILDVVTGDEREMERLLGSQFGDSLILFKDNILHYYNSKKSGHNSINIKNKEEKFISKQGSPEAVDRKNKFIADIYYPGGGEELRVESLGNTKKSVSVHSGNEYGFHFHAVAFSPDGDYLAFVTGPDREFVKKVHLVKNPLL